MTNSPNPISPQTLERENFYQGFAAACADLARNHGQPSMAIDIMNCNGVTLADLIRSRVDEFDLKPLRAEWRAKYGRKNS